MAGAMDIKKETLRIRREQRKRNEEARKEAEARRTAMEAKQPRPSNRRRRANVMPEQGVTIKRDGHRVRYVPKLDSDIFASEAAEELAKEAGLETDQFEEFAPTGKTGYTAGDVRDIIAFYEEKAELEAAAAAEEEGDEEEGDEEEGDDEPEEKQDKEGYEDKMDRSGEDK